MKIRLGLVLAIMFASAPLCANGTVPTFDELLARPVVLRPELAGVHPRVFLTAEELTVLRARAASTHRAEWTRVLADLPAMKGQPPAPPGPQERRSQNTVAFAIAGVSLAYAVEQKPEYLAAAKVWILAAIAYEPWGYTSNKPNTDLAAGHLLYAIGWAYDLLYHDLSVAERDRIRASLERHASLVYDAFAPRAGRRFAFTQNHNYIPTSGLAVTALALIGESPAASKWAALARAHHHRANQFLSPDGYSFEGMEYWIFSMPWLVHFYDAWEHSTGESFWTLGPAKNWKYFLSHAVLPDGQNVSDFGDVWEGALTRARTGEEYARVFPGGTLQSNYNVMYRVASRLADPEAQAVAFRLQSFGHSNLEEYWTLLWRDPELQPASMKTLPLFHHFEDMGVVFWRSSWDRDACALAFKAGPPEGHRVAMLLARAPEWRLDSGHSHPDNGSFIIYADGKYLTGDAGYAGQSKAEHHNTITVNGFGQGNEGEHDVWRTMAYSRLDGIRIVSATGDLTGARIEAEIAGAYAPESGLTRFSRTFEYHAPDHFLVTDEIAAAVPSRVAWYLHSDNDIVLDGETALLGAARPTIAVRFIAPNGTRMTTAPTMVTAPGQPGSITQGELQPRGYQLALQIPALRSVRVAAELRIVDR